MKLINLLLKNSNNNLNQTAAIDQNTSIKYKDLIKQVFTLADILEKAGAKPGVKIAIILDDSISYLIAFFAISKANATIVPCNTCMTEHEIINYTKFTDTSILITTPDLEKKLSHFTDFTETKSIITIKNTDSNFKYKTLQIADPVIDSQNKDVALMVSTSGSTGPSKVTMLTDHQLISNMNSYKSAIIFSSHQTAYCLLKLNHMYSISSQILTHISRGDTLVINNSPFFIKDFIDNIKKHRITITALVPHLASMLANIDPTDISNLKSLKTITLSSSPTPIKLKQKLVSKFPFIDFVDLYGMSEAGSRISICFLNQKNYKIKSVGKPIPGVEVKINKTNKDDHTGEVQVKSSGIMKGYYKMPLETDKVLQNGWLQTGDIGRLDSDGNLFIEGRKQQIIISNGEKINPYEIEQHLLLHQNILEAAVTGHPDQHSGQVPHAYIVTSKETTLTDAELIKFCRKNFSNYKIPRKFYQIPEMPKLANSKIDKSKLSQYSN